MTAAITCTGDDLTLVCGKSSTGKTTLAKRLLSRQSKPVKVINDSTDDLDPSWQKIQWPELESQSGIALLVEDVINATPAEFNHLSRLLNYGAHHRSISPIYILVHSLHYNNVLGLLSYVHRVVFTCAKTNADSISAAMNFCRFPRQTRDEYLRVFLADKTPFCYYVLHMERRTFTKFSLEEEKEVSAQSAERLSLSSTGGQQQQQQQRPEKKAQAAATSPSEPPRIDISRFLQHMADPEKAALIYELVFPRLTAISPDYLVQLESKRTGRMTSVSLIDYLHVITDETSHVSGLMNSFHTFIMTRVSQLPLCLVVNKKLASASSSSSSTGKK